MKVLSDSRLRDAYSERLQSNKRNCKADAKCHLNRAIFYESAPSSTPQIQNCRKSLNFGVADGIRTHDNRNHNPGLYQLSYSHH